jgi:hypothetical protein
MARIEHILGRKSDMRLCFGTFATVLKRCIWRKGTYKALLIALIKTIDSDNGYINNNDKVRRLYKCIQDFLPDYLTMAQRAKKEDVIKRFENDVICLIDGAKKIEVVLALLHIIEEDTFIDSDSDKAYHFKECFGKERTAITDMLKDREFVLSDLLASTLLYTLRATENRDGRECVEKITDNFIEKFAEDKNTIRVWDTFGQYEQYSNETEVSSDLNYEVKPPNETLPKQIIEQSDFCFEDIINTEPIKISRGSDKYFQYLLQNSTQKS